MATSATRRKLTPQQQAAIHTRSVSVALSAGAGCGKTFVLTERFLSHLDPAVESAGPGGRAPARLDELIGITFTRRAAREMRERIRAACHARLIASASDGEATHWLTLVRGLERARISTIDAFCANFLRSHAVEAGLDPAFRVLDAAQAASLVTEAVDSELRRMLVAADESLLALAVDFGLRGVREMIQDLLIYSREPIDAAPWLERTPDELVDVWDNFRQQECLARLADRVKSPPEVQWLIGWLSTNEIASPIMQERQSAILQAWDTLGPENLIPVCEQLREQARVNGAGVKKALMDLGCYEEVKDACERLRKATVDATDLTVWDRTSARRAAEAGLRLLRVTAQVQQLYRQLKRNASALDFRDLVGETRRLLSDPRHAELKKRLSSDIRLLLVDEFQDTDPVQVELIEALCGDDGLAAGRLFFVGDIKQSIYRFRGADPTVFASLRAKIAIAGRLPLSENFRSQPAILNFVNALFVEQLGAAYERLLPRRVQVAAEPAVEFLWASPPPDQPTDTGAFRELEADWLARRIRQLLDSQEPVVWDQAASERGQPAARPARLGDVAILLRALSDVHLYEAALQKYGLDYYLVGGHAFYSQQEVFDLLNLLRALSSPADMVSLLGVLRSPFFALDDETLFWLGRHPEGLMTGLASFAECSQLSAVQRETAEFAHRVLAELRDCKDRLPVAALIERILALTGYDALLLTEFLGTRKLANLRKLVEQARSFDSAGVCTLAEFVAQLDEFVSRQPDEAMAATEPEAADVIRLMTIHQSKGLEFPIVVVPDLQRSSRSNTGVVFSSQLGPLVNLPSEIESSPGLTGRDLYGIVETDHDRAESRRLLYVATTRAADYLILSSGLKPGGDASSIWMRLLASRFDLSTGELKGILPDGFDLPQVRVTTVCPELAEAENFQTKRPNLLKVLEAAEKVAAGRKLTLPAGVGPVPVDVTDRRQFSFSELDGSLGSTSAELEREWDIATDGVARSKSESQLLGTLVHALLAEGVGNPSIDLEQRARHLIQLLGDSLDSDSPGMGRVIAEGIQLAARFLASPRCQDLRTATVIHPEIEFLLAWPPGTAEQDGTYFRGFIDCLWRDAGGRWHVLDYKTNQVTASGVKRVAESYIPQMLLYALAVEQAVGEPPASLTLSFLEPGVEFEVPYSPAARQAAIAQIDAALAAYRLRDTMAD